MYWWSHAKYMAFSIGTVYNLLLYIFIYNILDLRMNDKDILFYLMIMILLIYLMSTSEIEPAVF